MEISLSLSLSLSLTIYWLYGLFIIIWMIALWLINIQMIVDSENESGLVLNANELYCGNGIAGPCASEVVEGGEGGEVIILNVGPRRGKLQPSMNVLPFMGYSMITPQNLQDGWRPVDIGVGMALSPDFTEGNLRDFATAFTKQCAGLDNDMKICHTLWNPTKKRQGVCAIYCSLSHRSAERQRF